MTSAREIFLVLGITGGCLLLAFVIAFVLIRGMRDRLRARVEAQISPESIVLADWFANNFGVQSRGATQTRGNGALVLTRDALLFFMMVPSTELRIPLSSITAVSFVKRHLGKGVGRKLLAIDFQDEAGQADRIALFVREPDRWHQQLQPQRGGSQVQVAR